MRTRRWAFFGLVGLTTLAGVWMMVRIVGSHGFTVLEGVILALFAPTFAWIVVPFWTAVAGFTLRTLGRHPVTLRRATAEPAWTSRTARGGDCAPGHPDTGRSAPAAPGRAMTAIVVPVFNEDPDAVAARVGAMACSLTATGFAHRFHVHLLSDTSDPRIATREERAWLRLQAEHPGIPIFYRRRPGNEGRKAGNIGEFCRRCVDDYDFMVVLDADSLMTGATLVELAAIMEANPEVGLVQTVPLPALQRTLFGRLVQFAGCLYGPLLATGQSFWQTDTANYWGHNAIVRLRAFTEHARLPVLPGRPPLGGEVLSHDFVEAALLRRAGWTVVLWPTLGGSWEEVPGHVVDYATRDRRWAQGSLQHLRLLREPGLHPVSRLHFVLGAMGYLSSLLWLLILLAGTMYVLAPALHGPRIDVTLPDPTAGVSLLAVTAVILFFPKLLGVVDALARERTRFGGAARLVASGVVEAFFSVLLAPIMMLHHARFVTSIIIGRSVAWDTQRRDGERLQWREAWRAAGFSTAVGVVWGGVTLAISPLYFAWMSPIFLGLVLSVPLLRWTSSPELGLRAGTLGLLRVPSEITTSPEIAEVRRALWRRRATRPAPIHRGLRAARPTDPDRASGVSLHPGDPASERPLTVGCSMHNAERGLFDLRQGRPLLVTEKGTARGNGGSVVDVLVTSVEGLSPETLDRLRAMGSDAPRLVVTNHRVAAMRLAPANRNGKGAPAGAYALPLASDVELHEIVELSCGPFPTSSAGLREPETASVVEGAALSLLRLGRLLPAVVAVPVRKPYSDVLRAALDEGALLRVDAEEVRAFVESAGAEVVPISEAPVPLPGGVDSRFVLFREGHGLQEHVAILVGDEAEWPDPVPVRLHSACLTGDLFGSLRCDCGEQLQGSIEIFSESGGGVLLYLAQEGRGIGLRNKFRAYKLQDDGMDTIDADSALGFGPDERRYDVAVRILQMIGVERIELLTNNPEKVRAMEEAGITVVKRRALHGTLNRHNLPYVRAKVQRAGHWLEDMLSQPLSGG